MLSQFVLFAIIFVLNLIPAFAPPTWLVLSVIGFNHPDSSPLLLALIGATAATLGRLSLAKLSCLIVRQRFLSNHTRQNIDIVKTRLEHQQGLTCSVFLLYAFSPLPSNSLFIAYGLTGLDLRLVALPFFFGRFLTYTFWIVTASEVAHHVILESASVGAYMSVYFVVTQLLLLSIVYLFTKNRLASVVSRQNIPVDEALA
ncbi:MAG: hypothetical protein KGS09_16085 [Nitrospirae bacterium]|nr:hypothetical protein [Nitrospirota bacterium]MBU6482056.1 hypothetical protein [Nitrospirota bacterium]